MVKIGEPSREYVREPAPAPVQPGPKREPVPEREPEREPAKPRRKEKQPA